MGWSRRAEALLNPAFLVIRPIPPLAWIPLAIVWLGLGDSAKIMQHAANEDSGLTSLIQERYRQAVGSGDDAHPPRCGNSPPRAFASSAQTDTPPR